MEKATVIINNRDLLEWPKAMCEKIELMDGVGKIIFADNASTNSKLLEWYKICGYKVFYLENIGHKAPWESGIVDQLDTNYYVVSDPDLDLSNTPSDTIQHLIRILKTFPQLEKIGLSLQTTNISKESPYFNHVQNYEARLQNGPIIQDKFVRAPVDTTFAVYDKRLMNEYKVCGARTISPYIAKHIPWHIIKPEGEFKFYLENADSASSSYLWFTGFEKEKIENKNIIDVNQVKSVNDQKKMPSLDELFKTNNLENLHPKWSSYFPIYEKYFEHYRNLNLRFLEIGERNFSSLISWSKYFENASLILGCDVYEKKDNQVFENPVIKLISGKSTDPSVYNEIVNYSDEGFDIIVDDGSHQSRETISNFINLFPLIKPGGIYVVEDIYHSYWPESGGGFFNKRSAANFFKLILDLINIEHCKNDFTASQLFQTFFEDKNLPSCLTDKSIFSISSFNSIFIIEKYNAVNVPILGEMVT